MTQKLYPSTILLYMTNMFCLEEQARVLDIISWDDERKGVILDQTIFYPQGGGQPYDQGVITSDSGVFDVQEVRFDNGIVYHVGIIKEGEFLKEQNVQLQVAKERRMLNSKNHTAGHIIDIAMSNLGMNLKPGRAYHFPDGAYVEYLDTVFDEVQRQKLKERLQEKVNRLVAQRLPIAISLMPVAKLQEHALWVPDVLPVDKPCRVMTIEGFYAIPCGGTHVANTADVGTLTIEKIKNKKGNLRVSYSVVKKA